MKPKEQRLAPYGVPDCPAEAAALLRGADGFVFLHTQSPQDGDLSILGCRPQRIWRGELDGEGAAALRDALGEDRGQPDLGYPSGGLVGWTDYEGGYLFGDYAELLVYRYTGGGWIPPSGKAWRRAMAGVLPSRRVASPEAVHFRPVLGRGRYCEMVRKAKDYIAAGDIYQVNLAREFVAPWDAGADAFPLYQRLAECSPAPHAAFLDLGGRQVLSSSPERFLRMSGRVVETRPIKGTRPRFRDPERDESAACELVTSPKEMAELVMITDLQRNDLGMICEYGSVHVEDLLKLESFSHVHHLVSTVTGTLRGDVDHVGALRSCFPGGSISGAPKIRAMEIISELEAGPRGLYTGAIGYLGRNGESQFNIAIRTAVVEGDRARFHVGSGIVADSSEEMEFEETNHKAAGLLAAAGGIRPLHS